METLNRHKITIHQLRKAYRRIRLVLLPLMATKVEQKVFLNHGILRVVYNSRELKIKWSFINFGGNRHLDIKGESNVEIYDDGSWLVCWDKDVEIPWHLSHELYHRLRVMGMREDLEFASLVL